MYHARLFQPQDATQVSASITACAFYQKMGYTYKNGIDQIDDELLYRLEKFRFI